MIVTRTSNPTKKEKDAQQPPQQPQQPQEPQQPQQHQQQQLQKPQQLQQPQQPQQYVNASGTMVITPQTLQAALHSTSSTEENFANSTGTMVVSKTPTLPKAKEERFLSRAEMEALSTEDLQKWHDSKLEKKYKKECDRILRKWKEEKSAVLYAMRKKEIDVIEQKYQQMQLDLERELQEKIEKV